MKSHCRKGSTSEAKLYRRKELLVLYCYNLFRGWSGYDFFKRLSSLHLSLLTGLPLKSRQLYSFLSCLCKRRYNAKENWIRMSCKERKSDAKEEREARDKIESQVRAVVTLGCLCRAEARNLFFEAKKGIK